MTVVDRCANCGAKRADEAGACAYCGSDLGSGVNVPAPAPDRVSARIERFDRLAEDPDFDKWMKWRPRKGAAPKDGALSPAATRALVFGAPVAVLLVIVNFPVRGQMSPLAIFGPFVGLAAVVLVVSLVSVTGRAKRPPVPPKAYPALVVTKRSETRAHGEHARTDYFVTMEFRTGRRREYRVSGDFFGTVVEDDLGLAYVQDGTLTNFRRFDV